MVDRVVKFIDVCVYGAEVWLNSEFENAPFLKGPRLIFSISAIAKGFEHCTILDEADIRPQAIFRPSIQLFHACFIHT